MKYFVIFTAALVLSCGCLKEGVKNKEEVNEKMALGKYAVIETNKGTIKIQLYDQKAPITTNNFIGLAEKEFYDGLIFHRVEPNFVIQTGDPTGTGRGGSNKTIPLEINPELKHDLGAVGMARTSDPNSATSQFYIVIGEAHFLDGSYAVFGQVVEGLDVAKNISVGDKMKKVTIVNK